MRLRHFSQTPHMRLQDIEPYDDRIYRVAPNWAEKRSEWRIWGKPRGAFWVSDEDAHTTWSGYCNDLYQVTNMRLGHYIYDIVVHETDRVLYIDDMLSYARFENTYAVAAADKFHDIRYGTEENYIDWGRVDLDYDAVIISPFRGYWHLPCTHWYYGWDCASGPILHPRVIKSLELVDEQDLPSRDALEYQSSGGVREKTERLALEISATDPPSW